MLTAPGRHGGLDVRRTGHKPRRVMVASWQAEVPGRSPSRSDPLSSLAKEPQHGCKHSSNSSPCPEGIVPKCSWSRGWHDRQCTQCVDGSSEVTICKRDGSNPIPLAVRMPRCRSSTPHRPCVTDPGRIGPCRTPPQPADNTTHATCSTGSWFKPSQSDISSTPNS